MDIVYSSLERRPTADPVPVSEVAEAVDALRAHAAPGDGLEHVSALPAPDRLDLLFYLLAPGSALALVPDPVQRTAALLARCHRDSPLLNHRYLPPVPRSDPGQCPPAEPAP
ncbi:MAG TPA: hypothetical protein VIU15_20130 [Streptomyces sp.]